MHVHISLSWNPTLAAPPAEIDGVTLSYRVRDPDWGLSGARGTWHHVRQALTAVRETPRGATLLIASAGTEVLTALIARAATRRRIRIAVADMLLPPRLYQRKALGALLRRVDQFICIRRADIATLTERFGVHAERCSFVAFPAPDDVPPTTDGGYVYSGGLVHRDWTTLFAAAGVWRHPTVFSVDPWPGAAANVSCVGTVSPQEGRKLMAGASVFVSAITDTELPAGPLVLLDAMAMGKAVVATDVRANRDYVTAGVDALVVPPRDPVALAAAVDELMRDDALRHRIGAAARARAAASTMEGFWREVIRAVTE